MLRTITLAALLSLLAHTAVAAEFSIEVTTSNTTVATGAPATFRVTARNAGTTFSPALNLSVEIENGRFDSSDTSQCVVSGASRGQCAFASLAGGETRTFTFTARASNRMADVGTLLTGRVTLSTVIPDDQPVFVSANARVPITMSPAQIDLGVAFAPRPAGPERIGTLETRVNVENKGPSTAGPVVVTVQIHTDPVSFVSADAPWLCGAVSSSVGTAVLCSTPQIGAGQSLPLTFRLDVPLARTYVFSAKAWANDATDINSANDTASVDIQTGAAADFTPILIPLLVNETPGLRATWTSELWALPAQNATLVLCRTTCPADPNNAARPRATSTERLFPFGSDVASPHGAMIYIERARAADVTFSARLFSSRGSAARGVELPIVRESEFRNTRLVIPAVVLDANHRFKLRVYDPDATPNTGVVVRLFDRDSTRVIVDRVLPLATRTERVLGTTLPGYPGYAEIDDIFNSVIPTSGSREIGIEVTALNLGTRLWAFVSATENEGEHVTLATPQ